MRLALLVLMASAVATACSHEPEQGPHQYLRVEMIHETGGVPTDVSFLSEALLGVSKIRFNVDSNECEQRLKKIEIEQLRIFVTAFNTIPSSPDIQYERAVAIRVQCVQSFPFDEKCFKNVASESEALGSPQEKVYYMFNAGKRCIRSQPVGFALNYSLRDK